MQGLCYAFFWIRRVSIRVKESAIHSIQSSFKYKFSVVVKPLIGHIFVARPDPFYSHVWSVFTDDGCHWGTSDAISNLAYVFLAMRWHRTHVRSPDRNPAQSNSTLPWCAGSFIVDWETCYLACMHCICIWYVCQYCFLMGHTKTCSHPREIAARLKLLLWGHFSSPDWAGLRRGARASSIHDAATRSPFSSSLGGRTSMKKRYKHQKKIFESKWYLLFSSNIWCVMCINWQLPSLASRK